MRDADEALQNRFRSIGSDRYFELGEDFDWHQHYDALGIILYAYGETLTPDAGPFAYGHPLRRAFQSTAAHSTVCVDERNQNTSPCTRHRFFSNDALSFIDASHEGYKGITHRRQILFVRPIDGVQPYFVVMDRLTGKGRHKADLHFHLLKSEVAVDREHMAVRTTRANGANVLITALKKDGITFECRESWIMTGYGRKTERPDVVFKQDCELPTAFVTLLVPFTGVTPPRLSCQLTDGVEAIDAIGVKVESEQIREIIFAGVGPGEEKLKGVEVSGRAGLLRWDSTGDLVRQVLVGD